MRGAEVCVLVCIVFNLGLFAVKRVVVQADFEIGACVFGQVVLLLFQKHVVTTDFVRIGRL